MCGRARLSSDVSEIKLAFSIPPARPAPNVAPNWNVAPTDPMPIVHYDAKQGARDLEVMRWGLIPYWAKDIKIGFSTINARAEEVDTKPAFREAFQRRRARAQFHDRHDDAERIVRRASQPHAGGPEAAGLASMARRGTGRRAAAQSAAGPLPFR
jgi:putative SOS response-associated peptidase YedK